MNCPICSLSIANYELNLHDDRYGYPGRYDMFRCQNCGHAFLSCDFSPEQIADLYSNYYPRALFNIEQYKPHQDVKGFRSWLDGAGKSAFLWVPRNVRVLDVGCGFGEALGYHEARGCDVYGVEADENIRRVAEKFGYKVHVGLFNPDLYEASFFDYVTMDQVIEHVADPLATLQGVARVLRPGGRAILSTPNANGWGRVFFRRRWINWHAPYHVQFFSRKSILLAAEKNGFKIQKLRTITSSEWLLYQWIHLLLFPKETVPSVFWDSREEKKLAEKLWIMSCVLFHKIKINHLLTRFFDAIGFGDSYLIVLEKQ